MTTLHFLKPGLQTLVVDQGREGYRAWGVPVGGAMDRTSARLANWLVGNPLDGPVLEITLMGPLLGVEGDCQIALTGAHLSPKMDQKPLPMNETVTVKSGAQVSFGKPVWGCRSYLAVRGAWQVKKWLGSCSALAYDSTGVTDDSLIKKNTRLKIESKNSNEKRIAPRESVIKDHAFDQIRVLPGPEFDTFSAEVRHQFFNQNFLLSAQSNRMGYRLTPVLNNFKQDTEVISSGIVPGTIQVTASGQLVLLMVDAQISGGYPRMANVITADLDVVGQLKPGDEVKFLLVDLAEAYQALAKKQEIFNSMIQVY